MWYITPILTRHRGDRVLYFGRCGHDGSVPAHIGVDLMRSILGFIAGGLFGAGLVISGMTDTVKVQGWLDVFGAWDPTLAFVMGGAIIPMAIAWHLSKRRSPLVGGAFPTPADPKLGRNLVLGSVMFGMGWGLVGLCPGPTIASIGFGGWANGLFILAMIAGMALAPMVRQRLDLSVAAQ